VSVVLGLVLCAALPIRGRAAGVVVILPLEHRFSLPETILVDELLAGLSKADEGAFLVTAHSAYAGDAAFLEALELEALPAALRQLASRLGVREAVALRWDGGDLVLVTAAGIQARQPSPRKPVEAKPLAAQLLGLFARASAGASAGAAPSGLGGGPAGLAARESTPGGPPPGQTPSATPTGAPAAPTAAPQVGGSSSAGPQPAARASPSPKPVAGAPPEQRPAPASPQPQGRGSGAPQAPVASPAPPALPAPAGAGSASTAASQPGRLLYELAVRSYREANYALALDRLEAALRAGASPAEVLELQAKIYAALGDSQRQQRALRELVQTDPTRSRAVVALALLLDQQGLWQEAVRVLEEGLAAKPDEPQLYLRLAEIYQRQRRVQEALETLRRGLAAVQDPELALQLAAGLQAAGAWDGARALYAKLGAAEDTSVRARALNALGDLYARLGLLQPAVEAYLEAARARGEAAILTAERYRMVYRTADAVVESRVAEAWRAFEGLAGAATTLPREEALAAVQAALAEVERAASLCDDALPPPELSKEHRQRQLYYSLLREALTAALTFVDTGRADMVPLARQRLAEAQQERPGREEGK
jgi:tetratricopeptide (TPR) repeat protein